MDISTKEGKQRLIDGFINAIYLYDDKITFTFNYKDGTKTVFLSEVNCTPSGSDLKGFAASSQYNPNQILVTSEWFGFIFTRERLKGGSDSREDGDRNRRNIAEKFFVSKRCPNFLFTEELLRIN